MRALALDRRPGPGGPQAVVREGFFRGIENRDVFDEPPWMDSRRPREKPSRTAAYRLERARHNDLTRSCLSPGTIPPSRRAFFLSSNGLAAGVREGEATRPCPDLG